MTQNVEMVFQDGSGFSSSILLYFLCPWLRPLLLEHQQVKPQIVHLSIIVISLSPFHHFLPLPPQHRLLLDPTFGFSQFHLFQIVHLQDDLLLHLPALKMAEVEEVLEGVYVQQEEIRVSKDTYELLLQSEQIVVKSNILDLEDYDVKMEPKAIRSDNDNQSLYDEDDHIAIDDFEVKDPKEERSRIEEKKKGRKARPRKKMESESSGDEWEEYNEKSRPTRRKKTPRKTKEDEDDDEEEEGRRSWGTTSSRCCKCCRPVAGHPLPRHSKYFHIQHSPSPFSWVILKSKLFFLNLKIYHFTMIQVSAAGSGRGGLEGERA